MRVYLIGFKNSGKTTTGKKLAKKLGYGFLDLDESIEKTDGRTVPEIYSQDGEQAFREKEKQALLQTGQLDNFVISTGGGVPRFFSNMEWMMEHGITIYLKLDEETLYGRLKVAALTRPILKGKTDEEIRTYVQDLINNQEYHYLKAKYIVDAKNLSTDDIVGRILQNYNS